MPHATSQNQAIIEIKHLRYSYPETKRAAIDGVSLTVNAGEFLLLTGASGSGKSTLVRALNGLVPHYHGGRISGYVRVAGLDPFRSLPQAMASKVGFVFQDPENQFVMTDTLNELVFGLENLALGDDEIQARLDGVVDLFGFDISELRFIPELSGGQKQMIALASVIAMRPRIIVLDEPTSQLDPRAADRFLTVVQQLNREYGLTVLLIEHRLERCYRFVDRVVHVEAGRVVVDAPPRTAALELLAAGSVFVPPSARLIELLEGDLSNRILGTGGLKREREESLPVPPLDVGEGVAFMRGVGLGPDALSRLHDHVLEKRAGAVRRPGKESDPLLRFEAVAFAYSADRPVLDGVSFQIGRGEVVMLMGPNGCGKSTLLKCIIGLLRPQRGKVVLDGMDTTDHTVAELAAHCAYLAQNPNDYLFSKTVRDELGFALRNFGFNRKEIKRRVRWLLGLLGLNELARSYPRDLSCGERQRVALGSVLAPKPSLIVLDEPTRGMDYQNKIDLGELLERLVNEGLTLLVVTHDVEFAARYGTRAMVMDRHRIVKSGPIMEILDELEAYSPQLLRVRKGLEQQRPGPNDRVNEIDMAGIDCTEQRTGIREASG